MRFFFTGLFLIFSFGCMSQGKNSLFSSDNRSTVNLILDSVQIIGGSGPLFRQYHVNISNRFRVVTVINGKCGSCLLTLRKIEELIDKIGNHDQYSFLVYITGDDLDLFYRYNINESRFPNPLLYDRHKDFENTNRKLLDKDINSFLLNTKNEVILSGDMLNDHFFNKVIEHSNDQPNFIDTDPSYTIKPIPDR